MQALTFLVVILHLLFVGGCLTREPEKSKQNMQYTISEIKNLSALKLADEAKIIFFVEEGREGGEQYAEWIIHSTGQAAFPADTWRGGSRETIALLKDLMPTEDFGSARGDDSVESIWENKTGKWQAKTVETNKGHYLLLELFKQ